MAQVKVQGNALGSGSVTISAPNTNVDYTLTLPQASGEVLTSAVNTGFKNRIINGAMQIDQRNAGASVTPTSNGQFVLDRWQVEISQASKFSVQQNAGSVTPPSGFDNYAGFTSLSAYSISSTDYFGYRQPIEGFNVSDFGWGTANAQTVTLSFWVRSSLTGTFGGALRNGAADRSYPFTYTISSANTWEYKTITVAGDTSGTWLKNNGSGLVVSFSIGAGSSVSNTAGTWAAGLYRSATGSTSLVGTNGATFYITGVQLEKGSTATSFDYRPYGTELQLCQRYYFKFLNDSGAGLAGICTGQAYAAGALQGQSIFLPVTMRAIPTSTTSGTIYPSLSNSNTSTAFTYTTFDRNTRNQLGTNGWSGSSGLTAGNASFIIMAANAYFDASAEL